MQTLDLVGHASPRITTPPLGDDSRCKEIVTFAGDLGITLLAWQVDLFNRALRMTDGRYTHRTVVAICARQQGKTVASGVRALAELVLWDGRLVCMAAQSRDVALESFRFACELAETADLPIERIRKATGSEELILNIDGRSARLKVVSSTSSGARGLSPDVVIWDELAQTKTNEPYSALEKSRRARPNSQMFCITSAGTHESVVLNGLQEQGRNAAGTGDATGIGYYEWSAHPDRAPDDREGWCESNPALGVLIDEHVLASEFRSDPIESFEREVLSRVTAVTKGWLPSGSWEACADPDATVPDDATGLVFAVDAAPSLEHASICVAWPRPDGRTHLECVATFSGQQASGRAETRLNELVSAWQPKAIAVLGRGPAAAVAGRVGAATGTDVTELSGATTDRAIRAAYEGTVNRRIVHPPDPVLAAHLAGAQAGEPGTFLLRNRNLLVEIDAAVAAVAALWVSDRAPAAPAVTWVAV